ncbi:fungal-specific transcription factor domain-containing protein [Mrakia frigida]|uniref:transcription factor domain-containing protein n=1 Tax=Mrakia frigida TaxID=29902 RepID=UPI003FCC10FE
MPKSESDPDQGRPLTQSCSACRGRKIRCTGEKPLCENCSKNGRECEYRTKMKPGLKTGAGQVERRLGDIEQILSAHSAEIARLNYHVSLSNNNSHQHLNQPSSSSSQSQPTPGGSGPSPYFPPPPPPQDHRALYQDQPSTPSTSAYQPATPSQQQLAPSNYRSSSFSSSTMDGPQLNLLLPSQLQNPLLHLANQIPMDNFLPGNVLHGGSTGHFDSGADQHERLDAFPSATGGSQMSLGGGMVGGMMEGIMEQDTKPIQMAAPSSNFRRRSNSSHSQNLPSGSSHQKEHLWGISSSTPTIAAVKHGEATDIPPPEVVSELIALFFKHVHPNFPLLLHSDFTVPCTPPAASPFTPSSTASGSHPPVDSQLSSTRPSILVYGIICITLRFSKNPHFTSHGSTSKKHYHQVARQKVIMRAMDSMNVKSLQALAILALDSMESGEGPTGWGGVLSLLTGGLRHGNLGEEEPIVKDIVDKTNANSKTIPGKYNPTNKTALFPPTENWMEVEERRRLFWLVYILDRYASVSTGWAFEFGDEDVGRRLPCRDDNYMAGAGQQLTPFVTAQLPSPLSSPSISLFAYLSSLIHHLGQVHAFIRKPLDLANTQETQAWYAEFRVHDERLLGWWMQLPEKVKRLERGDWREGDGEGGLKALICTLFFATMIRLQSAAAYPPVSSPSFLPSESAGISCLSAARSMSRVATLVGLHSSPKGASTGPIDAKDLSPLFGWTCWVGARALVAHAYIKSSPLLPETALLVETLNALSPYWHTSKRYAKILTAAVQESHALHPTSAFAPLISSPASNPGGDAASSSGAGTISILADMRRTAWNAEAALRDNDELDDEEEGGHSDDSGGGLRLGNNISNVRGGGATDHQPLHQPHHLGSSASSAHGGVGWDPSGQSPGMGTGGMGRGGSGGGLGGGAGLGNGGGVDFSGDWVGDLFTWFEVPPMSLPPSPTGH